MLTVKYNNLEIITNEQNNIPQIVNIFINDDSSSNYSFALCIRPRDRILLAKVGEKGVNAVNILQPISNNGVKNAKKRRKKKRF